VLVLGFPAAAFGTNCYVVAPAAGEQCVVVDPGMEVGPRLDELLAEHRLDPVAVLLTHGHLDHTFSVTPVAGARGIPAWIHPGDRELLNDPLKGLSHETASLFGGRLQWTEPEDIRLLEDGAVMDLAGLHLVVDHAPGHTAGSVMFRAADGDDQWLLSGDVLFEGSIGRTDLPGGSFEAMMTSLATKCLPLDDRTMVLPGHGAATTIGRERVSNPYLVRVAQSAHPAASAEAGGRRDAGVRRGL
jgi:glyoxylase-like metal-dependent hydrolase (beta-lactamase superfamily II)